MEKMLRFEISIGNIQEVNPLFSKCDIRVLYTGHNRNGSHISKTSVEKSLYSIFNIPIVGEFLESTDNFGGHGGKLEITDKEVKFIQTTKPYGVVPESAKTYWENIDDGKGNIKEYLIVEGAYLWTGRYSELNDLLNKPFGQSMEIEIQSGQFEKKDGKDVFVINDFLFSALCILGVDKDGEGFVEPCFEDANITAYSLDKQGFKEEFNQMIKELQFSLSTKDNETSKEGGETVNEKLEMLGQFSQLGEEVLEQVKKSLESYSLEDLESKLHQMSEAEPRVEEEKVEEVFEEVVEEVIEAEPVVVTEDVVEEVEIEEVVEEFDYKAEYEKIKTELETISEKFSKLEKETQGLREFKDQKDKEDKMAVVEKFSELPEEAIKPFMDNIDQYSKEDLELNLLAEVGKRNLTFSKKDKKKGTESIVSLTSFETTKTDAPAWFALVEEYKNNKN